MYKQVLKFEARGNNCEAKSNEVVARFVSKGSLLKKEEKKEKKIRLPSPSPLTESPLPSFPSSPRMSTLPPPVSDPSLAARRHRNYIERSNRFLLVNRARNLSRPRISVRSIKIGPRSRMNRGQLNVETFPFPRGSPCREISRTESEPIAFHNNRDNIPRFLPRRRGKTSIPRVRRTKPEDIVTTPFVLAKRSRSSNRIVSKGRGKENRPAFSKDGGMVVMGYSSTPRTCSH